MSLLQKIISYFLLRAEGVPHKSAMQEFKRNPLTLEDWTVIGWFLLVALVVGVLMYDRHHSEKVAQVVEKHRIEQHKRQIAEHKAIKHEQILLTMLNGGYVRIDGVTRKTCVMTYAGECM